MFVCICNQVTDKQIRQYVQQGVYNFSTLSAELSIGTCCGKCKSCAKKVMREEMHRNASAHPHPAGLIAGLSPA